MAKPTASSSLKTNITLAPEANDPTTAWLGFLNEQKQASSGAIYLREIGSDQKSPLYSTHKQAVFYSTLKGFNRQTLPLAAKYGLVISHKTSFVEGGWVKNPDNTSMITRVPVCSITVKHLPSNTVIIQDGFTNAGEYLPSKTGARDVSRDITHKSAFTDAQKRALYAIGFASDVVNIVASVNIPISDAHTPNKFAVFFDYIESYFDEHPEHNSKDYLVYFERDKNKPDENAYVCMLMNKSQDIIASLVSLNLGGDVVKEKQPEPKVVSKPKPEVKVETSKEEVNLSARKVNDEIWSFEQLATWCKTKGILKELPKHENYQMSLAMFGDEIIKTRTVKKEWDSSKNAGILCLDFPEDNIILLTQVSKKDYFDKIVLIPAKGL